MSLHADALAARAANDPNRAARAWRALLDQSPDDWRLALELKCDLEHGLHVPDSDAWFRRAAPFLPDAAWIAHYVGREAFHGTDLDAIDGRATALLAAHGANAGLHAVLGHVARQRQRWPRAVEAFDAASRLDPAHARHLAEARAYATLADRSWAETGPAIRIAVINLDRNAERMAEVERRYASSPGARIRLAAVEGARLPAAAVRRLTGDPGAPRGTLGCFLSHAAAWESLLAGPDAALLVAEDDAIPLVPLPARLGALPLPEGWDVVWLNDRATVGLPQGTAFQVLPLATCLAAFGPARDALGADGYLISRAGAETLLAWVAADGCAGDVDWRMAAYALDPAERATMPPAARRGLDRVPVPRAGRLHAWALHPPLLRTIELSSDRCDANRGDA